MRMHVFVGWLFGFQVGVWAGGRLLGDPCGGGGGRDRVGTNHGERGSEATKGSVARGVCTVSVADAFKN